MNRPVHLPDSCHKRVLTVPRAAPRFRLRGRKRPDHSGLGDPSIMKSFAISLVFLGIAPILAVVGTLLGSAGASQLLALPVALAAMTACLMLVGGLLILEFRRPNAPLALAA